MTLRGFLSSSWVRTYFYNRCHSIRIMHCAPCITLLYCNFFNFCTCAFISQFVSIVTRTCGICKYLLTYLLQGGRYIQSLHVRDFEPMHRLRGRSSTASKASGLGDKAPEVGEYLSNKYEIRIPAKISVIPNLWTKNNVATARRSSPSVVNSQRTTIACRSHSGSSFVHSTMTTGRYATRRAVRWCQPRLVVV